MKESVVVVAREMKRDAKKRTFLRPVERVFRDWRVKLSYLPSAKQQEFADGEGAEIIRNALGEEFYKRHRETAPNDPATGMGDLWHMSASFARVAVVPNDGQMSELFALVRELGGEARSFIIPTSSGVMHWKWRDRPEAKA